MTLFQKLLFYIFILNTFLFGIKLVAQNNTDTCTLIHDSILHIAYYTYVDEMPTYMGGEQQLSHDLSSHLVYPADMLNIDFAGRIIFSFIIEADGKISNFEILKPTNIKTSFKNNLLDLQKYINHWLPGKCHGKAVAVSYKIPMFIGIK